MKTTLAAIAVASLMVPATQAGLVYSDDFSAPALDPTAWNAGGGFFLNTNAQNVLLSTFGSGFGFRGDGSGAAGLNSTVGYASFTVTDNGVNPLGGAFIVANDNIVNTADGLVNVPFATGGSGTYQVLWNNSGVLTNFSIPGWSGTIGADSTVWIVNWDNSSPNWGTATSGANVNPLEPANRFAFWIASASENAVIDNLEIYDNLDVISPPPGPGAFVVYDNFTDLALDPTNWPSGGGFFLNTNLQSALLSSFGSGFGWKGDGTGVAGLNSTVGYASFKVTDNGIDPLGGNFTIGNDLAANTGSGLVTVSLLNGGPGTYEVVWNNSGVSDSFSMPISGWSGTIGGDETIWIVNGDTANAQYGTATSAANVDPLDPANRYAFWVANAVDKAVIDNVRIADTLTPGAAVPTPTLQISQSGSDVIVDWAEAGFKLQSQSTTLGAGLGTSWTDYPLPAGTNPPVTIPIANDAEFFRLTEQ
jgi:hypothetical protein